MPCLGFSFFYFFGFAGFGLVNENFWQGKAELDLIRRKAPLHFRNLFSKLKKKIAYADWFSRLVLLVEFVVDCRSWALRVVRGFSMLIVGMMRLTDSTKMTLYTNDQHREKIKPTCFM